MNGLYGTEIWVMVVRVVRYSAKKTNTSLSFENVLKVLSEKITKDTVLPQLLFLQNDSF